MSAFDLELEHAKRIAIERGFGHLEFNWVENDNRGASPYALGGTVTVDSSNPAVRRSYRAAHGKTWLPEFENDLAVGTFGMPNR